VEAVDLYRFFHAGEDETLALRGVSLQVHRGEMVAVTGPSGSGKSTLLACLAGLDEPDGGAVRIDGVMMSRRPEKERAMLRAAKVGMLFQSANLLEHLTVQQNIEFVQRLAGRVDRTQIAALLNEVGLSNRASAAPTTLSGGETAKAGVAVALANSPQVVLADEPTGELDVAGADRVIELLRNRARAGAGVLVVTHNPHVAAVADTEIRLFDGRIAP